jgi:hypothetical protein
MARGFLAAPDQAGPAAEKKIIALRTLRVAKFIEWFDGSNTP